MIKYEAHQQKMFLLGLDLILMGNFLVHLLLALQQQHLLSEC